MKIKMTEIQMRIIIGIKNSECRSQKLEFLVQLTVYLRHFEL